MGSFSTEGVTADWDNAGVGTERPFHERPFDVGHDSHERVFCVKCEQVFAPNMCAVLR